MEQEEIVFKKQQNVALSSLLGAKQQHFVNVVLSGSFTSIFLETWNTLIYHALPWLTAFYFDYHPHTRISGGENERKWLLGFAITKIDPSLTIML
jgi:pantothenate kinase